MTTFQLTFPVCLLFRLLIQRLNLNILGKRIKQMISLVQDARNDLDSDNVAQFLEKVGAYMPAGTIYGIVGNLGPLAGAYEHVVTFRTREIVETGVAGAVVGTE